MTHHLDIFMSGKNLRLNGLIVECLFAKASTANTGANLGLLDYLLNNLFNLLNCYNE